jgi:hypothetical protein
MSDAFADAFAGFLSDPTVTAVGGAIGAALVALWVAAAWWAYTDAARRTESTLAALVVAGWIIISTPLLVPFSLAIYSLARPQLTAADGRTRNLAEALVDEMEASAAGGCPACGLAVEPGWLRCPSCSTWLALPCSGCGTWSDPTLVACPFCGSEERDEATVVPPEPVAPAPSRARRPRRALRAVGPGSPNPYRAGRRPLLTPDGRPLVPARRR